MPLVYHEGGAIGGGIGGGLGGGMVAGAGGATGVMGGGMNGGAGMVGGTVAGGTMVAGGAAAGGAAVGGGSQAVACGCDCDGDAGAATLAYVGSGHGDYIEETTYRYVGAGSGNFEVVQGKSSSLRLYVGVSVGIALLVLILVLFLLPSPPTTTTTPGTSLPYDCMAGFQNWQKGWSISKKAWCCTHQQKGCAPKTTTPPPTTALPYDCDAGIQNAAAGWSDAKNSYCCAKFQKGCAAPAKTCLLWGDPHIISFDQVGDNKDEALSFYGDGDYWLVKTSTVSIQGRFEGTKYPEGLAATNQIVVGGAFLHNHKIEVGTRDSGVLTVDGQAVFSSFPSTYAPADGSFKVSYSAEGKVPDVIPEGNEKRVVHMELPLGIVVKVFQWDNFLDVQISMSPHTPQDGVCGNFNGNPSDDTTETIMSRVGARVAPSETLLSGKAKIEFTPQMQKMMSAECPSAKRTTARGHCTKYLGAQAEGNMIYSCMFDVCFGMNVRARSHAKMYH